MATTPSAASKMLLRDLRKAGITVTRNGPASGATPGRRTLNIARGESSPLAILGHEAGHIKNPGSLRDIVARQTAAKSGDAVGHAKLSLKAERAANRAAVSGMKVYGVSRQDRNAFRETMRGPFAVYRSALARQAAKAGGAKIDVEGVGLTPGGLEQWKQASSLDKARAVEKARKRLLPGYADAKRAASIANQGELKKFFSANLSGNVDRENYVLRDVAVLTGGLVARGHDLEVDSTTIAQAYRAAVAKGQIPVKVDHKSGAAGVCGYLDNFRVVGLKLIADWHLLQSHPQAAQILETAERMPGGFGLSAAFMAPTDAPSGKARVKELLGVDLVSSPAANPDGIFAARTRTTEFRAVPWGSIAVGGLGRYAKLRIDRRTGADALTGALTGAAITAGTALLVDRIRARLKAKDRTRRRELAAVQFGRRDPAIHRIIDATKDNLPEVEIPGREQAQTAARLAVAVSRSSILKKGLWKALKIGVGAGAGAYASHRIYRHAKSGAIAGAIGGILFENKETLSHVRAGIEFAAKLKTT